MSNFDMILEKIGPFGRYQYFMWALCSLAIVPAGIQNLLNVYLTAVPEHWCHVPPIANLSTEDQSRITSPYRIRTNGNGQDDSCYIRDVNYTVVYDQFVNNDTGFTNVTEKVACTNWEYDYELYGSTAVTKWDLVCSKSALPALAQSIYMLGFLLGAFIFGYLSDRWGRRLSLYISLVGVTVFGVLSAFMPDFWSHVIMRMIVGIMAAGILTVGFVMEMEVIGVKKRLGPGLSCQAAFACGYMGVAGVAYLMRDFVWTNFTLSVLPVVLLFYWWVLPESPRWLLANSHTAYAKHVLAKAAKMNKVHVDVDELLEEYALLHDKKEDPDELRTYTLMDLMKQPNLRKRSINMFYNWFVTSMVYYGLSMGVTDLAGDPYLNLFVSGLAECAAVVAMYFTLDRFGRRLCLIVVLLVGGAACIISGLLPSGYAVGRIILSVLGKFCIASAFAIIYVFCAELFPTVVRTIAVGGASMSARVGGLVAPFVAQLGRLWLPLPYVFFGATAISAGLLSILFPETLGQKLPDTIQEGEDFGRNMVIFSFRIPKTYEDKDKEEQKKEMNNMEKKPYVAA